VAAFIWIFDTAVLFVFIISIYVVGIGANSEKTKSMMALKVEMHRCVPVLFVNRPSF
jgi:hypothetical protein